MEDIDSSPASPNPLKRPAPEEDSPEKKPLNLKGDHFMMPTPPDTDQSSNASPKCEAESTTREASPAPSTSTLSSTISSVPAHPTSTVVDARPSTAAATESEPPPAKKRKLTPAEKEQQKKDKEAKAAEKAAEKARKEAEKVQKEAEKAQKDAEKAEEKARKDEEKRVRDEEKRKKAEEREAKKREKDLEEEKKAQEKQKKERSQMRLGAFFQKPATPVKFGADGEDPFNSARRKSLSLEPYDAVADQIRGSESPCKGATRPTTAQASPVQPNISDYRKYFLPFQLQTYSSLAPFRAFESLQVTQESFDHDITDPSLREKYYLGLVDSYAGLEYRFAHERNSSRGHPVRSVRQLVDRIQGSLQQPIDLTGENAPANPMDDLKSVSRRHIEFSEDVRPAYFGTYTKIKSPRATKRLCRNPFSRSRKDTDYDYDSEAEWEEPEEGEDLVDEEDDDAESMGDANEMDEFLDDEDDALKNKRKLITGDLVPTSSGLCWEDESGKIVPSIESGSPFQTMRGMRMEVLVPGFSGETIDPFSTAYWQTESTAASSAPAQKVETPAAATNSLMPPPRAPLQPRPNSNGTLDYLVTGTEGAKTLPAGVLSTRTAKRGPKATAKPLSAEDLEEFKGHVVGSQLTKAELLKDLKTRFPKITNDIIKSTLGDHFAQIGASKADKKWVYVGQS